MANQPGNTAPRGTSEEIQLRGRARRRLVGAIALVALIVVILPMVLDEQPNPASQDIAINIPSPQATEPASKIVPIEEPAPVATANSDTQPVPPAAASPTAAAPVVAPAAPAKLVAAEPVKAPVTEAPVKPANAAEPPKPADAVKPAKPAEAPKAAKEQPAKAVVDKPKEDKADKGGFVVQLGVYSNAANVKQMQAKLSGRGIRTYTETLKTDSGSKIRLRAGPYASRQEAERARDKLKAAGENGIVVANK